MCAIAVISIPVYTAAPTAPPAQECSQQKGCLLLALCVQLLSRLVRIRLTGQRELLVSISWHI
jgi:hypothetical protein